MNIYVVSNVWDRDGSTIIGAATDHAGAELIADRTEHPAPEDIRGEWSPWSERERSAEGSCTWERVPKYKNGTYHESLSQEIVRVPLAGYIGDWPAAAVIDETGPALMRRVPALVRNAKMEEIKLYWADQVSKIETFAAPADRLPVVTYPWADDSAGIIQRQPSPRTTTVGYEDLLSAIVRWRVRCREAWMPTDGVIRVGTGAARQWLERTVDVMPGGSRPATAVLSTIAGVPIVLDANMPPDEIRVGPVTYVVGTPDGIVRPGQMVRIELPSDG
jgi:hypothetical protein